MQLIYEGVDITAHVVITGALCHDGSGGRADAAEITMMNAAQWMNWAPKRDDALELVENGYTTGRMYVDMVEPRENQMVIFATSMPSAAHQRKWACHENTTLEGLMRAAGAELTMGHTIIGLDEKTRYPFAMRRNETTPAFMSQILRLEGGVLKCVGGKLAAIGIAHCQDMEPIRELEITSETPGTLYRKIDGRLYAAARVISPYGTGHARDTAAQGGRTLTMTDAPVYDAIQASRWARGALLWENRQAEQLKISMGFDPGMTAMVPISITGEDALAGKWMIDTAEHDLMEMTTTCGLVRCVTTIQ